MSMSGMNAKLTGEDVIKTADFTTFTARIRDDGTWDVTVDGAKYHLKDTRELKHFLEDMGV